MLAGGYHDTEQCPYLCSHTDTFKQERSTAQQVVHKHCEVAIKCNNSDLLLLLRDYQENAFQ